MQYIFQVRRFYAKVKQLENGCWEWQGSTNNQGYPRSAFDGEVWLAHRVAYTLFVGDIPRGLVLDHLCRYPRCVNPNHLEPVAQRVNAQRGLAGQATGRRNRAKTHCPLGHEYGGFNLRVINGSRCCRECMNRRARDYQRRRRELNVV